MNSTGKPAPVSKPARISARKRKANARNAGKSTGPRTPEGKARSSRNAVRHGMLARHVVPLDHPHEDYREYACLVQSLLDTRETDDPMEVLLLQRVAAASWRLARAWRYESTSVSAAARAPESACAHAPATLVIPADADLDRLIRYESMIHRELNRATRQLLQLRAHHRQPPREQPAGDLPNPFERLAAALAETANQQEAAHPPVPDRPSELDPRPSPGSAARNAPAPKEPTAPRSERNSPLIRKLSTLAPLAAPSDAPDEGPPSQPSPSPAPPSVFSRALHPCTTPETPGRKDEMRPPETSAQ